MTDGPQEVGEPAPAEAGEGEPSRAERGADGRRSDGGAVAGERTGDRSASDDHAAASEDAGGHSASDRSAEGAQDGRSQPPELVRKLQRRRVSYRQHGVVYRVAWVTAAVIVIAAGMAMIVFPGPALVVIPIGLAMLSLEFAWAQRLLDTTLEHGVEAKDIAMRASRRQKIVGAAAVACAVATAVALGLIYFL